MNPVPLYEMFPFLKGHGRLTADYSGMRVVSVVVSAGKTQLDIRAVTEKPVPPFEVAILEGLIAEEYGMNSVNVETLVKSDGMYGKNAEEKQYLEIEKRRIGAHMDKPADGKDAKAGAAGKKSTDAAGSSTDAFKPSLIMGRILKTRPRPIRDITIDDGKATVRGYVCDVRSRRIEKNNSLLLNFDVTDYTGTINVSKFLFEEKAQQITDMIKKGMYLTVSGTLKIYDEELTLSPQSIFTSKDEKEERTDGCPDKRTELHLHTRMSATDGLTDVYEVIERAAAWGHTAIAITDHGVVHSFPEAALAASAAAKKGNSIKIIYGMEGYFCNDTALTEKEKKHRYHIILLAKNQTGLTNLYKLVSLSHIKYFRKRPIIYKSVLGQHRDGLIVGSACESGELFMAIKAHADSDVLTEIAKFYDYLEIQPLCNNMFLTAGDKPVVNSIEDLRGFNRKVIQTGKALNIPVVATCDAHFLDPEDEIFRRIILTGKKFERAGEELPLYFRTTDEMLEEFSYLGEELAFETVVTNTKIIADMCEPVSPLPPKDKFFPPKLDGSAADLEKIIVETVPALYGDAPPYLITERVDSELEDILKLGYDVIYMAAQKLVSHLKSIGSRVGSRGSVGSSFVAYLAGITEVNPLPAHYRCPDCKKTEFPKDPGAYACGADMPEKTCDHCGAAYIKDGFNIPFETFLGLNGEKIPDIDLNISGEYSEQAQKFVYQMFGSGHVYRAGTIGTIAAKTAYGFVRSYLEAMGEKASKAEMNRLALGCLGVKQTTGQHPGGLIIIPQDMDVTDFCPVQYPSDDKDKEVITTHFDYHKMEDNLIKLDLLGHDNPTMLIMLERMTGIDADSIKLDDPDTMSIFLSPRVLGLPEDDEIIGRTGAIGIPEFGTVIARKMLCDTTPKNFDTLIRLSGYAHGTNVWFGNARELITSGKAKVSETISSRDDIMTYLITKGMEAADAFAVSESVRKGRGLPPGKESKMRKLGVPEWYLESCKKITYLFPRAHAVAYVIMAFRIAWFKVHRPLEYYSAQFYRRSQNGAFDAYTMTRGIDTVKAEIRRIKKLPEVTKKNEELLVSLESCYEFYMRGFDFAPIDLYESDAEKFLVVENMDGGDGKGYLRPPFIAVGGLGVTAALALAENRKGRQFISMEEITATCPGVNKTNLADLSRLGALGNLPETSQLRLF